jgi:hypothetical protein
MLWMRIITRSNEEVVVGRAPHRTLASVEPFCHSPNLSLFAAVQLTPEDARWLEGTPTNADAGVSGSCCVF